MQLKMFCVYDSKSQMFNTPFYSTTTGSAMRSFQDLVNDPQTLPFKHPGDFVLYEIGEFDDNTGTVRNYSEHHHLGIGSQFKDLGPQAVLKNGTEVI